MLLEIRRSLAQNKTIMGVILLSALAAIFRQLSQANDQDFVHFRADLAYLRLSVLKRDCSISLVVFIAEL
jgi:hypothetical protein